MKKWLLLAVLLTYADGFRDGNCNAYCVWILLQESGKYKSGDCVCEKKKPLKEVMRKPSTIPGTIKEPEDLW